MELSGMELSGIELSGLLSRSIEESGMELSGELAKPIELSGIELRGIELRGTPARASARRVTSVVESSEPIPKSEQLNPIEEDWSSLHHAVSACEPVSTPPRPIELRGVAPSSIELSGIELSGLDERSSAPRSTEFRFSAAVGLLRTSPRVTDSSGTFSKLVPASTPFHPVQVGDDGPHPAG
jgi:hypothetical protein